MPGPERITPTFPDYNNMINVRFAKHLEDGTPDFTLIPLYHAMAYIGKTKNQKHYRDDDFSLERRSGFLVRIRHPGWGIKRDYHSIYHKLNLETFKNILDSCEEHTFRNKVAAFEETYKNHTDINDEALANIYRARNNLGSYSALWKKETAYYNAQINMFVLQPYRELQIKDAGFEHMGEILLGCRILDNQLSIIRNTIHAFLKKEKATIQDLENQIQNLDNMWNDLNLTGMAIIEAKYKTEAEGFKTSKEIKDLI